MAANFYLTMTSITETPSTSSICLYVSANAAQYTFGLSLHIIVLLMIICVQVSEIVLSGIIIYSTLHSPMEHTAKRAQRTRAIVMKVLLVLGNNCTHSIILVVYCIFCLVGIKIEDKMLFGTMPMWII